MTQYYVVHSTSIENLPIILNTKILYANKYIDDKHMRIAGDEKLPYVYTSLYISCSKKESFGISLLFSPQILEKESFIFNYGWLTHPNNKSIYVASDDQVDIKKKYIDTIINYVKITDNITHHEILFPARIILDDYLIGIICPKCDNDTVNKLKKILKNNNYKNVNIYTNGKFCI